ncbi:hypothetical protein TELCIR_02425 [Teladorsagia circumcincta]|uniref:Crustacean CHH/MIH/GIH neurohormone family protein n=1 Tax=Teladorsagia circumcincta TaxID=45464 RepID=A0A2G9UZI1_TELCI|nr:hypothetical protein TELCIR_02425 [Teladorsagia circumcincta]
MSQICLFVLISLVLLDFTTSHVYYTKRDATLEKSCKIHRSPPVHHVMDQICLLCHEMFSHEAPNLRAECRSNCFRNDKFSTCMAMFSSKNRPAERDR